MSGTLQRLLRVGFALAFNPARLVEDAASSARRLMVLLACTIFAAFVLLPAIGCAAAGVWILVQHHLGPIWAAFITAAALALLAVIVLLIGLVAARDRRRRAPAERPASSAGPAVMEAAAAALPAALALLSAPKKAAAAGAAVGRGFFAKHKGAFLLGAAVVGLVMGQDLFRGRPRPRRDSK
jgi:hypothetical protein